MAKNKLQDLNDLLFGQLERLEDESLKPEQLNLEIARAKAITGIASQIVKNAKVAIEATRMATGGDYHLDKIPKFIGIEENK